MTSTPQDEFDTPWKDILEGYFIDFLAFFLPEAHADIDWERGFEFLDTELARITRASEVGDRRMDKLVKVWRRGDGQEFWVLIHIEVQGNRKPNFASGMYVYQYRAYDLHQKPVVGLAILADEETGWRPTEFSYDLWGTQQIYRFTTIKLLDYAEADLENSSNPFAIVTLAHLHAKKTRHQPEKRYQVKWHLIRNLYKGGFNRQQIIDLFRFIDWVLHLPDNLAKQLRTEIVAFEENQKMPYISSVERIGEKNGVAKMLTRMLQRRFGDLPAWANEKIAKAELSSLEEWSVHFVEAQSLDAIFVDKA
ncbi:MAG: hypothetical protein HQL65_16100 [Magnetococcales bacterium]|nr:hypothetical protein [Magnetococcales bacterium]